MFEDCDLDVEVHTCDLAWGELGAADAAFIAAARQDVPALVMEVRRLRAALNEIAGFPNRLSLDIAREALRGTKP